MGLTVPFFDFYLTGTVTQIESNDREESFTSVCHLVWTVTTLPRYTSAVMLMKKSAETCFVEHGSSKTTVVTILIMTEVAGVVAGHSFHVIVATVRNSPVNVFEHDK